MSKVKGIDNGYLYTKDNEKHIFRSAFVKNGITIGGATSIIINGDTYTVGAGDRVAKVDKSDSEMNHVCTQTMLAMDDDDDVFCLVVGLPIQQFATQKDKLKTQIMGYNDDEIIYNGKKKDTRIKDASVFPQGLGALMSITNKLDDDLYILFDFGGLTIDVALIEVVNGNPILQKYNTWVNGIQKIYSDIVDKVNYECKETLIPSDAENILRDYKKGIRTADGFKPNDFLRPVLRKFLEPILIEFDTNYPTKRSKISLCGGSSIVFEELFKEYYPKNCTIIPDSQFANAIGFHKIGVKKFCSEEDRPRVVPVQSTSTCNHKRY